jgi:hypothetical protein
VYRATTGFIHDSAFNVITKTWSDQVAPGSVPAGTDPYAARTFDRFHIVYVGTDGFVHDDFEDSSTRAWTDLIPPNSVKAALVVPAVTDFVDAAGKRTQHIVYVGQDGSVHNDSFDPATGTWSDQVPPGSAKSAGDSISAVDEGDARHFQIDYLGQDLSLHWARFDSAPRLWSNSVVPGSMPANDAARVGFANGFHVVYLGRDLLVHNDSVNLSTGAAFDQVPPQSIGAFGIPTITLGPERDPHPHIVYWGDDGKVHNDNYDPSTRTWSDQVPPGSISAQSSPNAATTDGDTFQVVYFGTDGRLHDDMFDPSTNGWSDTIPTGSVPAAGVLPAVANTDF